MSKLPSLLAITLLMATPLAVAEDDSPDDLRYCLELQSNYEIAKCAGEVSAGGKGRPYSREEVNKILSGERASAPISPNESSDTPVSDKPAPDDQVKDLLLEQDEGGSNQ
ncbi:MAG: hypothetical protein ACOY9D_10750 [Pseudomonadota bacterium]